MSQPSETGPGHATLVLLITSISAFITPFNGSAINIALPAIGHEFAMDAITLSWVATSTLVATAVFLVPLGRLADIRGLKKTMVTGLVVYIFAAIFSALSFNMETLMASRVLQGLASAMIVSTSTALVVLAFPLSQRGRVLGINVAFVYIGLSVGPFLGGILTQAFGWRSIFWLIVLLLLAPIILTLTLIRGEWAAARGEKFDLTGSIIYGIGVTALIMGFSELPGWTGFIAIILSILVLIGFVLWELRASEPVLNIALFINNRAFGFSNLAALINYAATFAVTFLLSLHLQYLNNMTPASAGIVLLAMPIMQTIFSPMAGRLSDRIEPRLLASIGMGLNVAGLFMLIFLNERLPLYYIIISLIILGLGFALFSSPNTNSVMSSVDRQSLSIASATLATMRLIGQMLSMGVTMMVLAVFIGHVQIAPPVFPQLQSSIRACFAIFTVLCFGGIFASLARGQLRKP